MKIIDAENIKEIDSTAIDRHDTEKKGIMGKLNTLVKKVVDCCIE